MRAIVAPISLIAAAIVPAVGAHAVAPDFSAVHTVAAAKALVAKGELVPILVFPAEFGGPNNAANRAYVTPAAAEIRGALIGTISRMIAEGSLDQMSVNLEFKGDSRVPARIHMKAWHSTKKGVFAPTIEVW
ncbi:hypothetical protein [Sphingomonas nostoxanthinifaciens]|uniref:hypothetical protein n=1 Tax=Sphingomonas nostoxanthinifaciens TaxID=2872652 RepID=UPI001CC1FFF2|nr:hypothetical protein [Sphingomonas nostoxanthinifaciens]UAK24402.1 hypothetical protein K8P63_19165 [Sphingomonas nostoxanthinifaciens]